MGKCAGRRLGNGDAWSSAGGSDEGQQRGCCLLTLAPGIGAEIGGAVRAIGFIRNFWVFSRTS